MNTSGIGKCSASCRACGPGTRTGRRARPGGPSCGGGGSGEAARVAAAEAVTAVRGDHDVVVAVGVARPADLLRGAGLDRHRLLLALVVVRDQGVDDGRVALVGQRERDLAGLLG